MFQDDWQLWDILNMLCLHMLKKQFPTPRSDSYLFWPQAPSWNSGLALRYLPCQLLLLEACIETVVDSE